MAKRLRRRLGGGEHGVAAVEVAIILGLFLVIIFAIMEFSRWLFTINAAAEATRRGARIAVVCDRDDADIKARMLPFLPYGTTGEIDIQYVPSNCTVNTCTHVIVSLTGARMPLVIPWFSATAPIPPLRTMLPRESMLSQVEGRNNPRCQ